MENSSSSRDRDRLCKVLAVLATRKDQEREVLVNGPIDQSRNDCLTDLRRGVVGDRWHRVHETSRRNTRCRHGRRHGVGPPHPGPPVGLGKRTRSNPGHHRGQGLL